MRKIWCVYSVLLLLTVMVSGCNVSKASGGSTEIKVSENTDRQQAFADLGLASVLDFDLTWQDADETELVIWAEQYADGKIEEQAISFTDSSEEEKVKGHIGMGIVDTEDAPPTIVVYALGSSMRGALERKIDHSNAFYGWSSIDDEKVKLEIGKTYTIGAYRVSSGHSIRTYNLQSEDEVKKMMKDDRTGFLLKVKLEKKQ